MKKIFLDCGTHFAQGLREISQIIGVDSNWVIHSWEANPYTFQQLDHNIYPNNYQFHNQAISDHNGVITLNIESVGVANTGQGSSIINRDLWLNPMHKGEFIKTVDVECIDLSAWLLQNCVSDDFVVIKLDIEGAEYAVLDKMIKDKSIELVDQLYIEWHARFFPNKEEYWAHQEHLIDVLRQNNVNIVRWG